MLAGIVAKILGAFGLNFTDRVLSHLERKAENEVEKAKVAAGREKVSQQIAASVVKEGMQHKLFWIPWSIAAISITSWFAWGVLDSMLWNGAVLPDVAVLPPQLKTYADIVWNNIFYSGAAVAGAQAIAKSIRR